MLTWSDEIQVIAEASLESYGPDNGQNEGQKSGEIHGENSKVKCFHGGPVVNGIHQAHVSLYNDVVPVILNRLDSSCN